jgi:TM2 domain-containing membrane protein YozV|tara:strand:+ start:758 stop:1414 length:657 start_codon:yes stop_codon:yes gene_type:complete
MSKYSKKKRLACLLLCAVPFTGLMGLHRLYLGRIKSWLLYILLMFLAVSSESNYSSFSNIIFIIILTFWLVDLTRIIFFGLKDDQGSLVRPYLNIPKFIRTKPSFNKFKSWYHEWMEEGEKLQAAEKAKKRRQKQFELSEKKSQRDKAAKKKYDEVYRADLLKKSQGMDMSYEPVRNIIEEESKNKASIEALKAAKEVTARQKKLEEEKKNKRWWRWK